MPVSQHMRQEQTPVSVLPPTYPLPFYKFYVLFGMHFAFLLF